MISMSHEERLQEAYAAAFEAFAATFAEAMDTAPASDEELALFMQEGRRLNFENGGSLQLIASNLIGFEDDEFGCPECERSYGPDFDGACEH